MCDLALQPTKIQSTMLTFVSKAFSGEQEAGQKPLEQYAGQTGPTKWMTQQLAAHNCTLFGDVELFRFRVEVMILRAPTSRGFFYFKCCRRESSFTDEALMISYLSQLLPEIVLNPVAVDRENRRILTADFGESAELCVNTSDHTQQLDSISAQLSSLQFETVREKVAELESQGLQRCDLDWLFHRISFIFAQYSVRSSIFGESLREYAPKYQETCKRLQSFGMPMTVIHGDPALVNIIPPQNSESNHLLHDFGEACIGHPLYDVARLNLDVLSRLNGRGPEEDLYGPLRNILWIDESILKHWIPFKPIGQLKAMMKLVYPMFLLHKAVVAFHRCEVLVSDDRERYAREFLELYLVRLYYFSRSYYGAGCETSNASVE